MAAVLLVAGCATESKYRQSLATLIGTPESRLVMAWGAPTKVYETGGSKFLTYVESADYFQPDEAPYMIGNFGEVVPTGVTSGYQLHRSCDTTFRITEGKVADFSFRGNACLSR